MLYLLLCSTNLTDFIIDNLGWSFMQPLWDVFDGIFAMLNALIPCPEMWTRVWEVLFT